MVRTGLERLLTEKRWKSLVEGRRVALLVNPTSVTTRLTHAVDEALEAGWRLVRLLGPEHGVRGEAQDMEAVDEATDPITGLPCVSLYGHTRESLTPSHADLDGVDVLVIDLQDIGARYYTYIYTAYFCAQVCGELGIDVVVCDRPNPIGGEVVEGNIVEEAYRSFVGEFPLATRHGMTFGEVMEFFRAFCGLSCNLTVVPMEGWTRSMWFDQTGLPWVMPSPNMPTLDTATVYPGQCLLEGTNISEARGTTRPFELFGAPWLDAVALHDTLNTLQLPGVAWRQVSFRPLARKFAHETCRGLQMHITDRNTFRSLSASLMLIQAIFQAHPEHAQWRTKAYEFVTDRLAIDLLLGDALVRHALSDGASCSDLEEAMMRARQPFESQRREVLIYS